MKLGLHPLMALCIAVTLSTAGAAPPAPPPDKVKKEAVTADAPGIGLKTFFQTVASSNQVEIRSSRLVASATRDEKVATFARKMIEEHTQASERLRKLAEEQKIVLNRDLLTRHEVMLDDLKKMTPGDAMNREYRRMQIAAHEESVALFEGAADSLKEPDVRRFAKEMLPKLKKHLEMARELPQPRASLSQPSPPKSRTAED